jgi:hypothetical protein
MASQMKGTLAGWPKEPHQRGCDLDSPDGERRNSDEITISCAMVMANAARAGR